MNLFKWNLLPRIFFNRFIAIKIAVFIPVYSIIIKDTQSVTIFKISCFNNYYFCFFVFFQQGLLVEYCIKYPKAMIWWSSVTRIKSFYDVYSQVFLIFHLDDSWMLGFFSTSSVWSACTQKDKDCLLNT